MGFQAVGSIWETKGIRIKFYIDLTVSVVLIYPRNIKNNNNKKVKANKLIVQLKESYIASVKHSLKKLEKLLYDLDCGNLPKEVAALLPGRQN